MKLHFWVTTLIATIFAGCSPSPQSHSQSSKASDSQISKGADNQASDGFQALLTDHWNWRLESAPTFATSLGVRAFDEKLSDPSLGAYDKSIETAKDFLKRLNSLSITDMSSDNQLNAQLLKLDLENQITASEFGGKYMIMTNRRGPHTQMTGLPNRLPFFKAADYKSYCLLYTSPSPRDRG